MIRVSECVVCGGEIRKVRRALVARFLATRIWKRKPFWVELVECRACNFLFYNPRLEPHEEARIYSGYRLEDYQKMRQSSEPRYTPEVNFDLSSPAS